jgi:succinate dehydrogenase/fumarate reductase-like Fe-S protein
MTLKSTLLIRRGEADGASSWSRFDITYESGQSVLDGLRQIRSACDPSLAFRYSCISANACKECLILIDGKVAFACTARLEPREMRLEPLPNKSLVRDLVTDIAPPDERLKSAIVP